MSATYKQVRYWESLLQEVRKVAATEEERAAFAGLTIEEASQKISELEQERDTARGALAEEPA